MKKIAISFLALICAVPLVEAADLNIIANNKESSSRVLNIFKKTQIKNWLKHQSPESLLKESRYVLADTLSSFEKNESYCDIGFSRLLKENTLKKGLIHDAGEFKNFVGNLRKNDLIDDILYRNILLSDQLDQKLLKSADNKGIVLPLIDPENKKTKEYDLEKIFADFKQWPDEISSCSISNYRALSLGLKWKNRNQRDKLLHQLNYLAFRQKIISRSVFNQLETIRQNNALDWPVFINSYLDVVNNAKDKLSPSGKPEKDPSKYSSEYADRKHRLTNRGRLYKNFDSTQVMMLAEIIQKTSKRMDAHRVAINFQFQNREDSETETYVLSPMERYRLSIKMLRKDMGEVMRSELFSNTTIEYEDLVAAAYETGLIKSAELELILKFEEFWNPKDPKWKIYANFAFSILGTATFYLPPPWNIVGAIALVITQTQMNKKQKKPDPDDNWNVVI